MLELFCLRQNIINELSMSCFTEFLCKCRLEDILPSFIDQQRQEWFGIHIYHGRLVVCECFSSIKLQRIVNEDSLSISGMIFHTKIISHILFHKSPKF